MAGGAEPLLGPHGFPSAASSEPPGGALGAAPFPPLPPPSALFPRPPPTWYGGSGSRHPPPSAGGTALPRRGTAEGSGENRAEGLWEAAGAGMAGKRGERGGGALGLGWSLSGGSPCRPRVGTRSDEDGEESGAGDHREILHALGE